MCSTSKYLWALLIALVVAIAFLCGMMSVVKGYVQKAKENPRQYYELKPLPSPYAQEVERIRRENGIKTNGVL